MSQAIAPSSPASVVGAVPLVPLAAVKAWLNITTLDTGADATLTSLINVASRQMLSSLDRGPILGFRSVVETRNGSGTDNMLLRYWPVLGVQSLYINGRQILPNTDPPFGCGYTLEQWTGSDIQGRQRVFNNGQWFDRCVNQNVSFTYTAGYQTVDTTTVPAGTGGAGGVYTTQRPWLSDQGVYDVTSQTYMTAVNTTPSAPLTYQCVDGLYTFYHSDTTRPIMVVYSYLPEELQQVIINFISLQFKYRDHIGVTSKALLGKETISYERGKWDALTEATIQPYRNVAPLL